MVLAEAESQQQETLLKSLYKIIWPPYASYMSMLTQVRPSLLGRINERQVLRVLQQLGPLSRAEVVRQTGLSAPTVSKAAASLMRTGLVEENDRADNARGRPAKKLRLACETTCVLGIVVDAEMCQIVTAGLDGKLLAGRDIQVATPDQYEILIDHLVAAVEDLTVGNGWTVLGIGLSMPGLVDYRRQLSVLSPNVPVTNGQSPAVDLQTRLGIDCVMLQECHALCLAERQLGLAQGLDDFAMLEVGTGVGLGVMSGGNLLIGHNGLAGEIGHITLVDQGLPCGCGNRGCLETVASDSALARRVSRKFGRRLNIQRIIDMVEAGQIDIADEIADNLRFLAIGLAALINLFNPSTLFVHGRQFAVDPNFFERLVKETRQRALPPSFAECRIVQAKGSKTLGAVAGIIQSLTSAIAPGFTSPMPNFPR